MNHFITVMNEELNKQLAKQSRAVAELASAPEGNLRARHRKYGISLYQLIGRKEVNISDDQKTARLLLKKRINKSLLKSTNRNISVLQKLISEYEVNDYSDVVKKLPPSYVEASTLLNSPVATSTQNKLLYKTETHIHETLSGVYVRSKSEVIIANSLTAYGISFHYEPMMPFITAEGKRIFPDFVIECPDGFVFIWEHLGLLSKLSYCLGQAYKLNAYNDHGFSLGHNLILTADDSNGGCNAQQIDLIIKTLILPHM